MVTNLLPEKVSTSTGTAVVNFSLTSTVLEMSALDVIANTASYRKTPVAFSDLEREELQLRVASRDLQW
ncbi:MAG: hypothetical protein CM1200mP10_10170 [Candidatus Neomarinimicrobiota bacterium]|nr:MAG: hypothetical protein CM1200mP10_10170 [Candidatus Neomarinimicrobiota bacterium]